MINIARICLLATTTLLAALPALAATYTWTGAGFLGNTNHLWSDSANWAGLAAPQPGETNLTLIFPNNAAPRATTNDVAGLSVANLQLQGAGYIISGKPSGNALTLHSTGLLGYSVNASATDCQIAVSSPLVLGGPGLMSAGNGQTLTVRGGLSGPGGFTKTGAGTLKLSATVANTHAGLTLVNHGVVELDNGVGLPFPGNFVSVPGPLVIGGADNAFPARIRLLRDGQIADFAPVTVYESGTLDLNGFADTVGPLTLRGATVQTDAGTPGALTLNGTVTNLATLVENYSLVMGNVALGAVSRTFNVASNSVLSIPARLFSGLGVGLTKSGPGELTLYGATNDYYGTTVVEEGALRLIGNTRLLGNTNGGTTVMPAGQLLLDDHHAGLEALTLQGGGGVGLVYTGTNSWTGPVTLQNEASVQGEKPGGVFDQLTLSGAIAGTGSLRKKGDGMLRLQGSAPNTFTGGLWAEKGSTRLEKSAGIAAVSGPITVGRTNLAFLDAICEVGVANQVPNQLSVTVLDSGYFGVEAGTGEALSHVTLAGGFLFSGDNALLITGNITNLPASEASGIYGSLSLNAGTHVFAIEDFSQLEVIGSIHGAGAITKTGTGGLTFLNTNSYSGLTAVQEGSLRLDEKGLPGSTAAGTVIEGLARLSLWGVSVTNEVLTLQPFSIYLPQIAVADSNVWKGPVVLNVDVEVETFFAPHLTIDGPVSGPGGIIYKGEHNHSQDGTLVLAGNTGNTFGGDLVIEAGTLRLNKQGASAVPGNLVIGLSTNAAPAATVVCQGASQFAPVDPVALLTRKVTIHSGGALHGGGFTHFIANLETRGGSIYTEGGVLGLQNDWQVAVGPGGGNSTFFGELRLASPNAGNTHDLAIETNASLVVWGDISEGIHLAHLDKLGGGELGLLSSNSFNGAFTVKNGRVIAAGAQPFGTTSGATSVEGGATVVVVGGGFAEAFTLAGTGYGGQGALVAQATNTFTGPILLAAEATIVASSNTALATFSGVLSGPGGLTKDGPGTVRLAGNGSNTFAGLTRVLAGTLALAKTNTIAIPGALTVDSGLSPDSHVHLLQPNQIADTSAVTLGLGDDLFLNGHDETIGTLSGRGLVFQSPMQTGVLTIGAGGGSSSFTGSVNGGGGLTKTGAGTFTLESNNGYTGPTVVNGGTLLVLGQQPQSTVSLQNGGVLGGHGRVGSISGLNGHLSPGTSPGILTCSNFSLFGPTNQLRIEITGLTPGTQHDQIAINGTALLMGGVLQLSMTTVGAVSNQYVILSNDGVDPISGTLPGLPQGATLTNNGVAFQISYAGGDGNDLVLTQLTEGAHPAVSGLQMLPDGRIQLDGTAMPNVSYTVEATTNLQPVTVWTPLGQVAADASGLLNFADAEAPTHARRFYRLVGP